MERFEWLLVGLLGVGALGHLFGTFTGYAPGTEVFVWSLTAVFYVFAVIFLQALRIVRKNDRWITIGATTATAVWAVLALAFGGSVGNVWDPRAVMHAGVSAALLATTFLSSRPLLRL